MTWLSSLLATRAGRWFAVGAAIITALFGLRATWRGEGRAEAERKAQEDNHARAIEIHQRAAEARADHGRDPADQLRQAGRLRD